MNLPDAVPTRSRLVRRAGAAAATLAVAALAAALAWTGTARIAANAARGTETGERPPLPVVTAPLVPAAGYAEHRRYPGRVEAPRSVALGFEAGGTPAAILADEGDSVAAGKVVARLDTRTLRADRAAQAARIAALAAERDLARLTLGRQKALLERNHVSAQRHDEARLAVARLDAEIAALEAGLAGIDVALDKAVLRAPFAARIAARHADEGAHLAPGAPVLDLIEDSRPTFRAGLPAEAAAALAPGTSVTVEIGGTPSAATVLRLRPGLDPATRTRDVILALDVAGTLPEATLGSLLLDRPVERPGAWVPLTALSEGTRGLWTLWLVAEPEAGGAPVARRESVELIHTDGDRAYVRGSFASAAALVAEGPHRLSDGQPIAPSGAE